VRVLLFTGKGGVGKTSVAAATALASADAGQRTLIISTDPAHSLADSFGVELGGDPTRIVKRLKGQQLDAQSRMEESWDEIQRWLVDVFNWAGVDAIEAEELAVVPGLDEVFALGDIKTYAESGDWDTLVVDCAPTAETIRLLSLPDILSWYMERVFPAGRRVNRMLGPVLSRVTNLPVAGDEVFGATRRFYDRLDGVKEVLSDRERTSVRLVVNPERMVIAEARRTYTYLSLFGYRVDAVIANRLLPDEVTDPWFAQWRAAQDVHMETIDRAFSPLPILRARLAEDEVVGVDRLRRFAAEVYAGVDPLAVLHDHDPMEILADGDARVLVLELPFADRDDVEVGRRGDELLVTVGPYRRALVLPDSLRRRDVTGAKLRKGRLRITFAPRETRPAGSRPRETS
jgi:arsenite/tail-anchored protein-transporting ATPase